jgi:Uma2 family endonuclease
MSVLVPHPSTEQPLRSERTQEAQRFLLDNVSWHAYKAIGDALTDRPALRLTYDRGRLEFMVTSHEHEKYKARLARLLDTIAEELNLRIEPAGNMTFRREDLERGLEPDECYWIANEAHMRAKVNWDPVQDPPPDLVIEIEITRSALNRMSIYAVLGVPEVWRFDGETIRIERLQADGKYQPSENSPTFPGVPMAGIAEFLQPSETVDYLSMVRAFRAWLWEQLGKHPGEGKQP